MARLQILPSRSQGARKRGDVFLLPGAGGRSAAASFPRGAVPISPGSSTRFRYHHIRQYSISCDSNGQYYRISVQREVAPAQVPDAAAGLVSNYLHESVQDGDLLAVHMPFGDFVLSADGSPVVLLSGGSGITAVLSMLEHLAGPQGGTREVVFIHGARGRSRHAFNHHVVRWLVNDRASRPLRSTKKLGRTIRKGSSHPDWNRSPLKRFRSFA